MEKVSCIRGLSVSWSFAAVGTRKFLRSSGERSTEGKLKEVSQWK
jgi:hypothetical protein